VGTFLRAYPYKATGFLRTLQQVMPLGEKNIKLGIPHFRSIEGKIGFTVAIIRHLPYPKILAIIVPRTPVGLIHGGTGGYFKGNTYAIDFKDIPVRIQRPVDITNSLVILYFIIHTENTNLSFQIVLFNILYAKIQHGAAILSSGKRDIDVVKLSEQQLYPLQSPFINILFHPLLFLSFFS
jgi:hypothetical protein